MPQEFDRRHSVAGALRRAALADIEAALGAVTPAPVAPVAPAKAVHVMRRRLKRLRALIRLPHAHLADFGAENRAFRDLGRRLAGSREAEVLHKTYDALVTGAGLDLPDAVKAQVTANDAPLVPPLEAMLADTLQPALHEAAGRIRRWRFDRRGFALIGGGLERTYRQMRLAGLTARDLSTPENLHEWRKQVKYHAAQLRLLAPVDPEPLEAQRRQAIDLARLLGEHHDCDVLRAAVARLPDDQARSRTALLDAIAARCAALEMEAFRLGDALTAETSIAFRRRIEHAWRRWRL